MKKTYLVPDIILTEVELQIILSGSDPTVHTTESDADTEREVLGRRSSLWDDEDDY